MASRPGLSRPSPCAPLQSATWPCTGEEGSAGADTCPRPRLGVGREAAAGGRFDETAVAEAQQIFGFRAAVGENERQQQVEGAGTAEPGSGRNANHGCTTQP